VKDTGGNLIRLAALQRFADGEIEKAKTAVDPTEHLRDAQAALTRALELEREAA
jgi:hypothetical protein